MGEDGRGLPPRTADSKETTMTTTTKQSEANTSRGVRVKSRVRAGKITVNHNQTSCGIRVTSRVKAGRIVLNHNQTARGLRVKSGVKAGLNFTKITFNYVAQSG
jgi:hypothetical protein